MPPVKTPPTKPEVEVKPSVVQSLLALEVGETYAMCERQDGDQATKQWIADSRERMRNSAASAVARAKAKNGGTYTVEGGELQTRSLDILCVITITRTA